MNTSHHTDRSSKRFSISKSSVALAIVFVLVLSSANARSAETRVDTAPLESEGEAISASTSAPNVSPVTLPIEVLGPDGYTVSVNVDVPSPGQVSKLYLQIHSPVYRDVSVNPGRGPKASVRLNGGSWIGIRNQTVDVFDHEAEFGGLNGTYHTVRMTIPVSALGTPQSGSNTLRFRFNGTDNHTLGFRVLDLNFLRSDGSEILPASAFAQDNPALWTPISDAPADINAGEELWRSAQLVDYPNGPSIQAACGDCHAQDGRDLWYFAYSDHSIVERSKFHGLSQEEAEQIASYIRSLQNSDASYNYTPPGRPWNPPFQPGPGLDALPAHDWSAGAGLGAVLERDADIVPHLFPNGINKDAIPHDEVWSVREVPIAFQLPDWNEWLPDVHPLDFWGSTFTNDPAWAEYVSARNDFEAGNFGNLHGHFNKIAKEPGEFYKNRGATSYPGNDDEQRRSLMHWASVKTWELHREFDLEDEGASEYGATAEARTWFGGTRLVYDLAPHMTAGNNVSFPYFQSNSVGKFFSTSWYQTQLYVNTGNTVQSGQIAPFDWNYHHNHIEDLRASTGVAHPFRDLLAFAKQNQIFGIGDSRISDPYGVRWKQQHPWRYTPTVSTLYGDTNANTLALVLDAVLGSLMDRIGSRTSGWDYKQDTDGDGSYCDEDRHALQPSSFNGEPSGASCNGDPLGWMDGNNKANATTGRGRHAEAWYQMIPRFRTAGVSETTLNRLIDWGEDMWPRGSWDDLRAEGPTSQAPVAGNDAGTVMIGGTVVIDVLADDYDPDGSLNPTSVSIVTGPAHGTAAINSSNGAITYTHDGSATDADVFTYTVADNEGNASNTAIVSITVNGGGTGPATHDLGLQTGWNLVALTVTPDVPVFANMFGDVDQIVMVKDASGQVFFPEYGLDQLGEWNVAQAYLVLMDGNTTLTVQGVPLVAADTPISLSTGWNLLPFFLDTPQPIEEALAPILDHLNYLSDEEGRVFDPGAGVNTIGMLEPGRGYRAHLSEDTVLIYTSDSSRQGEVTIRSAGTPESAPQPRR